jgi:phosphoglycolate phosphatase-like HAD superfamily hydrolase
VSEGLPEGAWLNPRTPDGGPFHLDTVVLDVDGVYAMQRALGVPAPWRPTHEDVAVFKRAGGFNDDVDLSIAMTAIGAAGRGADAAAIAAACEQAGGGLKALRVAAPELPRIAGREVLRVFDELYWGGLVDRELALVPPDFVRRLRDRGARAVALVTGRTPRELDAALLRLRWSRDALCHAVTGDMVRKPDPACLDMIAQQCNPRSMVYVGDVRDDWELVRRWREERPHGAPIRGVLVGDDAEMERYRPLGVDATVRRTADVLSVLARWS